jgi:hypothetical protein
LKKITKEIFFHRAKLIHGETFDYSKADYINNEKRIVIICRKHGEFLQLPRKHLEGQGCKRCSAKANQEKGIKPWEKEEDDFLIKNFPNTKITDLCSKMHRGKKFILNRAKELGLEKPDFKSAKLFKEIAISKFESYRKGAMIRNMAFEIKIEEVWDLFLKQKRKCALTGWNIRFGKGQTASLDRIDSGKGYTSDNIQWIHKNINILKMDWPESFLFDAAKAIFLKNKDKFKRKTIEWEVDDWHNTVFPKERFVKDDEPYEPPSEKFFDQKDLF